MGLLTPFLAIMAPNPISLLMFARMAVCARCPRFRAIWKGDINLPRIGCSPLCPLLGMGEPWVAQYGVGCLLPFFVYHFSTKGEKWLEATSRVDMGHIVAPKSHVSMRILLRFLLAMNTEIWDRECGPFRPIFAVFAILCHVGNTISPWGRDLPRKEWRFL